MASTFPYTSPDQALGIPQPPMPAPMQPMGVSVGGILPIIGVKDLEAQMKREATLTQQQPLIQSLAAHVRRCWTESQKSKADTVEGRMFQSLRQRRGEYDPDKLAKIRQQGGSEIYMMLTSVKCRGASSWLRDILAGKGESKPWTLRPTPIPSLPQEGVDRVEEKATQIVQTLMMQTGMPPDQLDVDKLVMLLKEETAQGLTDVAKSKVQQMERLMEDQLVEGGFPRALDEFTDDLTTFPAAFVKGPVIRRKPKMTWDFQVNPPQVKVDDEIVEEWERVDPFMIYPSPSSSNIDDGYLIERHRMRRADLQALIGVEGYDEKSIRAVLEEYGRGGLHEWLQSDSEKASVEGKSQVHVMDNSESMIDAIQFWGSVSGEMLRDWGLSEEEVPDKAKEYPCEVWLIGSWVIKASLNYHPLGKKPYFKVSYEDIPGSFWGNSVADLVRDCQDMCNSAARALSNNMGIASGPQVSLLSSRIPTGEDITQMYPWKIWQFTEDTMGGNQKPIEFFQPGSNSQELMLIYEKFSVLADEYSGIPRYMTGDSPAGGAGRTASGMSMLMNNANKSMKQVLSNVDNNLFTPLLERLYFHNMKYKDDPSLKGDVQVVAMGASGVLAKENAQVRRNEFLAATANPIDMQIVGLEGRAALLRKAVEGLDINPDQVVPSPEKLKLLSNFMVQAQQAQQGQQPQQEQQPGAPAPAGNGQQLQNGAPVTDNFQPPKKPGKEVNP